MVVYIPSHIFNVVFLKKKRIDWFAEKTIRQLSKTVQLLYNWMFFCLGMYVNLTLSLFLFSRVYRRPTRNFTFSVVISLGFFPYGLFLYLGMSAGTLAHGRLTAFDYCYCSSSCLTDQTPIIAGRGSGGNWCGTCGGATCICRPFLSFTIFMFVCVFMA